MKRRSWSASIARGIPLTAALSGLLLAPPAGSVETADPILTRQAAIVLRALTHDRGLGARVGKDVSLAVVSPAGGGGSEREATALLQAFRALGNIKVTGLPFRALRVGFESPAQLQAAVERDGVDVVCVVGNIDPVLPGVLEVTRRKKVLSASTEDRHSRRGVALVVTAPDGKPTITVNLPASRLEAVDFSSDLLRLATVIR